MCSCGTEYERLPALSDLVPFSVHSFLREQRDNIVLAWEASVQAEPRVVSLADAILRNDIPEFLDELAAWMELNVAPGTERMRAAAIAHAAQRLDHGFQLTQFMHEVRLLRKTLLRLLLTAETAEQSHETARHARPRDGTRPPQ